MSQDSDIMEDILYSYCGRWLSQVRAFRPTVMACFRNG